MATYHIIGGTILDGTGKDPFVADVIVENDRIRSVGHFTNINGAERIDASRLLVMPGAIDVANHSDAHWTLFDEPSQESLLRQGITTILVGNCGVSLAPIIRPEALLPISRWTDVSHINLNWQSVGEFLGILETQKLGVNVGTLVGATTLLCNVWNETDELTENIIDRAKLLLRSAFQDGAFGLSLGLPFHRDDPNFRYTLQALAGVTSMHHARVAMHLRDEGKQILASIAEGLDIIRPSNASGEFSHIKLIGRGAWEQRDRVIRAIASARREGLDVYADLFPYTRTGSLLSTFLPAWAREGNERAILARLRDPDLRMRVLEDMRALTLHDDRITIASTLRSSHVVGKTLREVNTDLGMTSEETVLHLLVTNRLAVTVFGETLRTEDIAALLQEPYTLVASDGIGREYRNVLQGNRGLTHPRSYGTVAQLFETFVKKEGIIDAHTAAYKLSGLPARAYGIKERGEIRPGFFADLVLIDPAHIHDTSTYATPASAPEGILWVFVNGTPVVTHGAYRASLAGRVIRHHA